MPLDLQEFSEYQLGINILIQHRKMTNSETKGVYHEKPLLLESLVGDQYNPKKLFIIPCHGVFNEYNFQYFERFGISQNNIGNLGRAPQSNSV